LEIIFGKLKTIVSFPHTSKYYCFQYILRDSKYIPQRLIILPFGGSNVVKL
jgi:hypothetical protein